MHYAAETGGGGSTPQPDSQPKLTITLEDWNRLSTLQQTILAELFKINQKRSE
jgi:hypothetical protein